MTDLFLLSNRLLTSGWWAYSRKPNYVADWIMSLTWGAIIGTTTIIPYFYSVFFITVLLHRCTRDFERYVLELIKKIVLFEFNFAYSGVQSSMGKTGNVTAK